MLTLTFGNTSYMSHLQGTSLNFALTCTSILNVYCSSSGGKVNISVYDSYFGEKFLRL